MRKKQDKHLEMPKPEGRLITNKRINKTTGSPDSVTVYGVILLLAFIILTGFIIYAYLKPSRLSCQALCEQQSGTAYITGQSYYEEFEGSFKGDVRLNATTREKPFFAGCACIPLKCEDICKKEIEGDFKAELLRDEDGEWCVCTPDGNAEGKKCPLLSDNTVMITG